MHDLETGFVISGVYQYNTGTNESLEMPPVLAHLTWALTGERLSPSYLVAPSG